MQQGNALLGNCVDFTTQIHLAFEVNISEGAVTCHIVNFITKHLGSVLGISLYKQSRVLSNHHKHWIPRASAAFL